MSRPEGGLSSSKDTIRHRLSQCHDWTRGQRLWSEVSREAGASFILLIVVYLSVVYLGCYSDGLRHADIWYFSAMSITTVGLGGDTAAQTQTWRGGLVLILPMGIGILSFGLAGLKAFHISRQAKTSDFHDSHSSTLDENKTEGKSTRLFNAKFRRKASFMVLKYVCVVAIGAAFFLGYSREQRLQDRVHGKELTVIDALFFSTSIATSVGYDDKITPKSDAAKLFLVLYCFLSTTTVASIVLEIVALYVGHKDQAASAHVSSSTLNVHKADVHYRGFITQADFLMFRLQELRKVNDHLLSKLVSKFGDLDFDLTGVLKIGAHVPSAEQVEELLCSHSSEEGIASAWEDMQSSNHLATRVVLDRRCPRLDVEADAPAAVLKISSCHEFTSSRPIWVQASQEAAAIAACFFVILSFCYLLLSILGEFPGGTRGLYFLAATLSTVGGKFAPVTQLARGFSVVLIPPGLVFIAFCVASVHAHEMACPPRKNTDTNDKYDEDDDLVDAVFETLKRFSRTIRGKICIVAMKMYSMVFLGAIFFMMCEDKNDPTWTDAMYYSTATATSIGYGDIFPNSKIGLAVFSLYMVLSAVVLCRLFVDLFNVWLFDFMGEKVASKIVDSILWLHRADVRGSGELTQSDYCMFMLQQLQLVDHKILANLTSTFEKLDVHHLGVLWIGEHIPSAAQAIDCESKAKRTGRAVMTEWLELLEENKVQWAKARHEGKHNVDISTPLVHGAEFISLRAKWLKDDETHRPFKPPKVLSLEVVQEDNKKENSKDSKFFGSRRSALRENSYLDMRVSSPVTPPVTPHSPTMSSLVSSVGTAMHVASTLIHSLEESKKKKMLFNKATSPPVSRPGLNLLRQQPGADQPNVEHDIDMDRVIGDSLDRPPSLPVTPAGPPLSRSTSADGGNRRNPMIPTAFEQRRRAANRVTITGSRAAAPPPTSGPHLATSGNTTLNESSISRSSRASIASATSRGSLVCSRGSVASTTSRTSISGSRGSIASSRTSSPNSCGSFASDDGAHEEPLDPLRIEPARSLSAQQIIREQIARRRGSARDKAELQRIVSQIADEEGGLPDFSSSGLGNVPQESQYYTRASSGRQSPGLFHDPRARPQAPPPTAL